jgi:hypothetical protein
MKIKITCLLILLLLKFQVLSAFQPSKATEDSAGVNKAFALLNAVRKADRFITKLDSSYVIDLPVGIAVNNSKDAEKFAIIISEIKVREGETFLTAYMAFTVPGTAKKVAFMGKDIPFSFEGGFKGPAKLDLVSDFDVPLSNTTKLVMKGGGLSSVTCDCNGFKEMQLSADLLFDSTLFIPENPDGTLKQNTALKTSFETTLTDWNDLMIGVTLEPFQLKGLKGVGFSINNAVLDLSDKKNPAGIVFNQQYQSNYFIDGDINIWQGLYIQDAKIRMPMQFRKKTGEELATDSAMMAENPELSISDSIATGRLTFFAQNLLIDELGFTAKVGADRLMTLDEGDLGGWAFSVDNFLLDIRASQLVAGSFSGQIRVSQLGKNNLFNYDAVIGLNDTYSFRVAITEQINMDLWAANMKINPNSAMKIEVKDQQFVPSLLLNGELNINAPINRKDTTSKKLNIAKIPFQGMKIQTVEPYFSVQQISMGVKQNWFTKYPVSINEIGFESEPNRFGLRMGLNVNFTNEKDGGFGGNGVFTVWGKKENDKWGYDGVEISEIKVDVEKPGAFELHGDVVFFRSDSVNGDLMYGDGFKGTLKAQFGPFGKKDGGGSEGMGLDATALFGNVDGYRYWFADALATLPGGIPAGPVSIYGFGGGAWYHMKQAGIDETPKSDLGQTVSGIVYQPNINSGLGLKASVKFATTGSQNAFNGDVAFGISFTTSGGLNQISLNGNGYFTTQMFEVNTGGIMEKAKFIINNTEGEVEIPVESDKSSLWGNVSMLYDHPNKCFHSSFDIYANIAGGLIKGSGPGGKAGWGVLHFEPNNWYIHLGTPDNPNGINVLNLAKMQNYFMAGSSVPELPPPPSQVLSSLRQDGENYEMERNTLAMQEGKGFALGANFTFDTGERTFLIFYGRFGCGLGMDILLKNYGDLSCEGREGPIGINGWYAQGQAWAWVAAAVGIKVDLPFYSGRYAIFEMDVAALMRAKAPNPFWMKGNVGGNYNILGGLVKGHCDFEFEIGEQCKLNSSSPFGGMPVIAELKPNNKDEDISVFTTPQVVFNMPVDEVIEFENENRETKKFRIKLRHFKVADQYGKKIIGELKWNERKDVLVFKQKEVLPGESLIKASVKVVFEEYKNGAWFDVRKNGVTATEMKEISFMTGKEPDVLVQENVAYSYPNYRAFNYYKAESGSNYIKLEMAQPNLFNTSNEWVQKARVVTVLGGQPQYFDYSYDNSTGQVNFAIPQSVANNKIYRLELVNLPANAATLVDENVDKETENVQISDGNNTVDVEVTTQAAEGSRTELQEKVIYNMEFRTSNYNTFTSKLNALNYSDGITWELYPLVHSLTVNISGERFDDYEVVNLEEQTMISCDVLLQETAWYKTYIEPYIGLSAANLSKIGAAKFKMPYLGSYLFQSYGTRRLTEEEIEAGTTAEINVTSGMKNYIAKYTCEYMAYLKNCLANTYAGDKENSIPKGQLSNLFNSHFTPIKYGNYPVNVKYTLPGQDSPNSVKKHIIKFYD